MNFSKMHRALIGSIVYWSLIDERLKALTNQAHINPRYNGTNREITVLPLQRGPYGSSKVVEFYTSPPEKHQIKPSSNFFIIGG